MSGTGRSLRQDRARDESVIGPAVVGSRQGCQAPHARTGKIAYYLLAPRRLHDGESNWERGTWGAAVFGNPSTRIVCIPDTSLRRCDP